MASPADNPFSNRSRMLVTGASGLLGANFALAARERFRVSAVYGRHPVVFERVDSFFADLKSEENIISLLNRTRPEIIVHFAAITNVDYCEEHPIEALDVNAGVTERLAAWAGANGARFLLMSTDSVFDGRRGGYTEDDEPCPLNQYAATKVEAEKRVKALARDHLIVRANIFGWNAQPKTSLAEWALERLEAGQQFPGFTDVIFAPLLVNTLADIMIALIERKSGGMFHAASSDALSKYEFALLVADTFGFSHHLVKPTLIGTSLKALRPLNTALHTGKLRRELGIELPAVSEDLQRFKRLRDDGFVSCLKAARLITHEQ